MDVFRIVRAFLDLTFQKSYTSRNTIGLKSTIPSYFYHQVRKENFNKKFKKIDEEGFRTLTFREILDGSVDSKKSLFITFDDGWSSVWSIAFPLAKKYGLKFTLFVVPKAIEDTDECRTTLDDNVDPETLIARDLGPRGFLTWGEVRKMYKSGLVDVQSHSLHHGFVFSSSQILGFSRPKGPFPIDGWNPLVIRENGEDVAKQNPSSGTILYEWNSALSSPRRFVENSEAREKCIGLVQENGGEDFFDREDWYSTLKHAAQEAGEGTWESDEERVERFRKNLSEAKRLIEKQLPGAQVRVLAPPWGAMHEDLPSVAQETGHELIVTGYRYDNPLPPSPIPVYPRLYGENIWPLLKGRVRGVVDWWRARSQNLRRKAEGAIP